GQPFTAGVGVGELLASRFGLRSENIDPALFVVNGYSNAREPFSADQVARAAFSRLCGALAENILEQAAEERAAYMDYLRQAGLIDTVKPAVVDIGWRANMQGALGLLLGRPVSGYYYATLQGAEVWKARGHRIWAYAGDMLSANHPSAVMEHRHLLEYLTCHVEPSLIRVEKIDGAIRPVFRQEENIGIRRQLIEAIHSGAIRFAKDMRSEFGDVLNQIWIDPFLGERVFASFVSAPHKIDAQLFIGHHFEDAVGGLSKRYII